MNTINLISVIISIIVIIICLLIAVKTNLLRESNSNESQYSFSRFQVWLWMLVICPAFVLNWGFRSIDLPNINVDSLILLGISVGATFTANIITSAHRLSSNKHTLKYDNIT